MKTDDIVTQFSTGELSRQFWEGLSDGRLLIPLCTECGRHFFFPRRWCPFCWSDAVQYDESDGTGAIFAISELYTAFQGVAEDELPVPIVLVELDEGVRIPGRLDKRSMPAIVGDRVRLAFADDPKSELPKFVTEKAD